MGQRQESIHPPPDGCTVDDYVEVTGGGKLGVKGKVMKVEDRWSGAEGNMRWKLQLQNGSIAWADAVIPSTKEAMDAQESLPEEQDNTHLQPRVSIMNSQGRKSSIASGRSDTQSMGKELSKQDTGELVRMRTRATSEAAAVAEVQDETGFTYELGQTHQPSEKREGRFLQTKRTEASIIFSPCSSEKTAASSAAQGKIALPSREDSTTISTGSSERNHLSPGKSQNWEMGPIAQRPPLRSQESLEFTDFLSKHSSTSLTKSLHLGEAGTMTLPMQRPVRSASAEPRSGFERLPSKGTVSVTERARTVRADSKTSLLDLPSPRRGARGRALSENTNGQSSLSLGKKLSLPGNNSPRHPRQLFANALAQVDEPESPPSKS